MEIPMQKNNPELRDLSRQLRSNMTKQERHLWYDYLRGCPHRFLRQRPLYRYIADFYCPKAKLVVELDGSQHYDAKNAAADQARSRDLAQLGIRVLRFPNNAVDRSFEGVCTAIDLTVRAILEGRPIPEFPVECVIR